MKPLSSIRLALEHFDGLYSKVYSRAWPSMRLGLLTPKKQCAVLNSYIDSSKLQTEMVEELNAIELGRYYKKHLQSYTRFQLRQQILENKKIRKRELMAKNQEVSVEDININEIEVSDVSDSELRGANTTDDSEGGFSSAEDLQEMFSDRRLDEDEKYFINRASPNISLNDFVPATKFIHHEEVAPDELGYYTGFSQDIDLDIEQKDEPPLDIPKELRMYTFPRNNWSRFEPPSFAPIANLQTYYMLDGASLLPVLALDLKPDETCADYCAAPGGKSLAMLMTLKPKSLLCNDSSKSRLNRLSNVFRQYLPDPRYMKTSLNVIHRDARYLVLPDSFDKILVDVPCLNDRNSVESIENNIFKRSRTEERLSIPSVQCDILKSALKSLREKGSVVYSTCTLSPVENDGVVQRALLQLREEGYPHRFMILNLKEAFRPFRGLFKFNTKLNYGQQVEPYVCSNFGPMYISKIKRIT